MSLLIAKGLRRGRWRFAICVGGTAVSTLLVLVLFAAYRSASSGVELYTGQRGLDLWVAPIGTDNLIRSSGFMSGSSLDEIARIPGVARVDPILRAFVTVEAPDRSNGQRLTLMGIGYGTPNGLGGPPIIERGRAPKGTGEVAIDRAAAHRLGVDLGDSLAVNSTPVKVAAITSGTDILATQFLFGDIEAVRSAVLRVVSFGVIEVAPGANAAEVASRIHRQFPQLEVMTRGQFTANSLREIAAGFRPMLLLVAILGIASAALLVAFLIEGVVEERRGELAVLLAAGATPATIGRGLMVHAAQLLLAGIALGAASAHLLAFAIDFIAPIIPLTFSLRDLLIVAVALSLSGVIAALVPLLRLKDIDPLEAFRS
jgi:putative ABC transport system permease protein